MSTPPNVLWFCTDQQRWDTIHSLGNPLINTPNIDRMVAEGVAFLNAYCQTPICTASRASFLTGKYPATHHIHRNGAEYFPSHETLVTKILADGGYECGLVGKLHLSRADILEKRPARDGYSYFRWSHHPTPDYPEGHDYADWIAAKGIDPIDLYAQLSGGVGPGVPDELHQTTWCTEMAIDFMSRKRRGPWLLSLNPFDPHPPFDPPEKYMNRYDKEQMPYPLFRDSDLDHQKHFEKIDQQAKVAVNPYDQAGSKDSRTDLPREKLGYTAPADYDARQVKACYYAMVEKLDHCLGELLAYLEGSGQLDNTMIIFTSDHGELLGDHGLIYKGCRFFEGLVHVPLLVWWPGKSVKGLQSNALVELVDLAPTVLDAAGIEVPYTMQGKSLLPIIQGEAPADEHKPRVVCEYNDALYGGPESDFSHGVMVFDGHYKVCIYQGHQMGEIYDLENDPGEFNNLWGTDPELERGLIQSAMDAYMQTSSAGIRRMAPY